MDAYAYDDGNGHQTANRYVNPNPGVRTGLPNLTNETPTGPAWFGSNNQITSAGWVTDQAGNIQSVGGMSRSFIWDAEDRQTSATINGVTYTYLYDGLGQRVQKTGNGATTTFVYDADGNLAAEYQIAGQLAAACPTATCYVTVDHLGSTRMITDSSGNVAARYDYLPFGTELQAGTGGRLASMGYTLMPDGFLVKFTGQARDQETGLDYMQARMYSAAEGWFTGVDPGNAGADTGNGQSWNGYAYVGNNPMTLTDPSGMVEEPGDGGGWSDLIAAGIVAGIEALGRGLEDLFGGGGSHADLSNVAWTPTPTWSVTGWGTADASRLGADGVYSIPGLVFLAQTTAYLPRTGSREASKSGNVFTCASNIASKYSIAGGLHSLGIGNSGVGGFVTNALSVCLFSGLTNLAASLGTGSAGGHSVFYNMGLRAASGPLMGIPAPAALQGTPWAGSATGALRSAALGAAWSATVGSGTTVTTLAGEQAVSFGLTTGGFATGVGEAKFIYDGASYALGLAVCAGTH